MPSLSALFWGALPLLLGAIVYQAGFSALIPTVLSDSLFGKVLANLIWNIATETRCYRSVKTLDPSLPEAHCFSVVDGKFTRVFEDTTSFDITKESRKGYVYPGLWDGHGHLLQYGELLHSANLFGAKDMDEVHQVLLDYKAEHEEAGSSDHWLRGVGWDQLSYGRWPVAVCSLPFFHQTCIDLQL